MTGKKRQAGWLRRLGQGLHEFLSHEIWRHEVEALSRPRAALRHSMRLIVLVIRGAREHGCTTRAAALTFITVMGLVPSLAVALSVMNRVAGLKRYEERVTDYVVERFIAEMPAADGEAPELAEQRASFRDRIKTFIGEIKYGRIGAVALAFCVFLFYQLLSSMEAAFNNIWGVRRPRTLLQKLRTYWMLAVVPLLVAGYLAGVSLITRGLSEYTFWARAFRALSEVGFVWMAFLALYELLPKTRVRFVPAASAALFSAALVQLLVHSTLLATWVFGRRAQTLAQLYGTTVAIIPLFLFAIYVLWLIALLGAELAYAGQNVGSYARDRQTQQS
ncbi:MAG: YihY/virulence factor BrkB family protein [Planctomycetota bacterium]